MTLTLSSLASDRTGTAAGPRVLFVIPDLQPGGAARQLMLLASGLA
jgi:hypothetical protein